MRPPEIRWCVLNKASETPAVLRALGIELHRDVLGLGFLRFQKRVFNQTQLLQIQDLAVFLDSGDL